MSSSLRRGLRSTADQTARMTGLLAARERELAGGLTVLGYHRVLPEASCPGYPFPSLAMPLEAFREQLRWLAASGEVLPLARALEHHAADARATSARTPPIALTFDDGYRDSSEIVAGELEALGLRGTFFVTTGFVATGELLWFDRAALLFAAVPERVRREVVSGVRGARADGELPAPGADAAAWTERK